MDGGSLEEVCGELGASLVNSADWITNSKIFVWGLVLLGSLILNATLLLAFLKRPGLRTISNRFVMNLTTSNLVTCVLLSVFFGLNSMTLSYTPNLCAVSEGGTGLVTTSSILTVLLIAVDQYFAVVDPLRYRSRVDKMKCGLLIGSIWIIAAFFGFLAAFNPHPQSLWQSCNIIRNPRFNSSAGNFSLDLTFEQNLVLGNENSSGDSNFQTEVECTEGGVLNTKMKEESELQKENSALLRTLFSESNCNSSVRSLRGSENTTYGLVYSVAFSLFVYLLPFLTVSWIYINIYSAARDNSERTRRTGSRPMLSTGSFCDEYFPLRQQESVDQLRKIPKISSLSSIDERSESPISQITRSKSSEMMVLTSNSQLEDKDHSMNVIFTVGSQQVENSLKKQIPNNTKDISKVPISSLRANFFNQKNHSSHNFELVKSRFPELPEQKRKSSYDLMYDGTILEREQNCPSNTLKNEDNLNEIEEMRNSPIHYNKNVNCSHKIDPSNTRKQIISDSALGISSNLSSLSNELRANDYISSNDNNCARKSFSTTTITDYSATGNFLSAPSPNNTPIVTISPPFKYPHYKVPYMKNTSSYINSLKYRISNGSIFKYREETRAARISALVIVMGFICWTPYIVILNLKNFSSEEEPYTRKFDAIVLSFLVLSTYMSPLLFGYRSKRVKRELRKLFCFKKELSYKNNRSLMAKKVLKRRPSGTLSQFEIHTKYNIFHCVYGRARWLKEKVHLVQVSDPALTVETCRSSFSSGASTQISSTSTDEF